MLSVVVVEGGGVVGLEEVDPVDEGGGEVEGGQGFENPVVLD